MVVVRGREVVYQTYSLTIPTGAIDSAAVGLSRAHLSSLVSMPLLVKAMAPKGTFVVISSMVTLAVQALESVRARCASSKKKSSSSNHHHG